MVPQRIIFLSTNAPGLSLRLMVTGYEHENWLQLCHAALLELSHAKMAGRIAEARASIVERMSKLQDLPGLHDGEISAIGNALHQLRILEGEEQRYTQQEKHRVIDNAVDTLKGTA